MQLTLPTLGLKCCYRSLRHFTACIFYAASTINFTEWMSVSHTYRICFIMALLLQSIMNLVSDVWLSRKRCADWTSGVASNKPFVLRHKLSVDRWYETAGGRKEKRKGFVKRSARTVHTFKWSTMPVQQSLDSEEGQTKEKDQLAEVVPTKKGEK